MLAYVKITAEEMPAAIGEPVVAELQPAVEVIDARVNMGDWLDKAERSDAPVQPGRRQLEEYDQLEHCPDEQRGVKMLRGPPPTPRTTPTTLQSDPWCARRENRRQKPGARRQPRCRPALAPQVCGAVTKTAKRL